MQERSLRQVSYAIVCLCALMLALSLLPHDAAVRASIAQQTQTTPLATSGTGGIMGRVVDADSGAPVAGAIVSLAPGGAAVPGQALAGARGTLGAPARGGGTIPAMITDSQGRFVFTGLAPGQYGLGATAPGYVGGNYGRRRIDGPTRTIALAANQRVTDADVRVWKHASISGRVLDEMGEPMVNVSVRAFRRMSAAGSPRFPVSSISQTDDRGAFRMYGLVPGSYTVAVPTAIQTIPAALIDEIGAALTRADPSALGENARMVATGLIYSGDRATGIRTGDLDVRLNTSGGEVVPRPLPDRGPYLAYTTTYHPSARTLAAAGVVTLTSGAERANIDVRLEPVDTHRVSGAVSSANGPAGSAGVLLTAETVEPDPGMRDHSLIAVTDAAGRFTFLGVPAGRYALQVEAFPTQSFATLAPPIVVAGADVENVPVRLVDMTVGGRVAFVGATTTPFGQVQQMLVSLTAASGGQVRPGARPDADGRFAINGHPSGLYFVNASAPGPDWTLTSATLNGADVLTQPLVVSTESIDGIVVTFSDRKTTIHAAVRGDPDAIDSALVVVFPGDFKSRLQSVMAPRLAPTAFASATGEADLPLPRGGDYFVAALPPEFGGELTADLYARLAAGAARVTVRDGERAVVTVPIVRVP